MGGLAAWPATIVANLEESRVERLNLQELERSAALEDANATAVLRRGSLESGLLQSRGSVLAGAQRVAFASAGVDASTGTAADVMDASSIWSDFDASVARNDARRAAMGHKEVARRYRVEQQNIRNSNREARSVLGAIGAMGSAASTLVRFGGG